ncbi:MAG: zinc-ribbon domain-containing protein [Actinobacteria bacterium]|nr:zinc-ribbon domain-containing protein [Actinomycetota bacterium]
MENDAVKHCPDCGMTNQETNIFCPQCGHCFLDEPEEVADRKTSYGKAQLETNKRLVTVLTIAIIILAMTAGVASFLISREIQRSMLVTVETGTRWKCSQCGSIFKDRVAKIDVEKSESDKYGVETIEGTCYRCLYGEQVGRFVELLSLVTLDERFGNAAVEMDQKAAEFISANPGLFQETGLDQAPGNAVDVDPRLVVRDYSGYVGTVVHVQGKVTASEIIKGGDGTEITYIELTPQIDGQDTELEFLIVYFGVSDILQGDIADCYLLPVDLISYDDGSREERAVLSVGIYMTGELP